MTAHGHDHDDDDDDRPSPDQDAAQARAAFDGGQLKHAAFHIGCALSTDPQRAEWLALLEEIVTATDAPLSLAPLEDANYFPTVAVRAWILARQGDVAEALGLLLQVATVKPESSYLAWGVEWLRAPDVIRSLRLAPVAEAMLEQTLGPLSQLVQLLPSPLDEEDPRRASAAAAASILETLRETRPDDPQLLFFLGAYLRRLGRFDEALALAAVSFEAAPGWQTAIAVASVHRDAGDVARALVAYEQALRFDPDDISCHLDLGDMLLEHGRPDEAAARYQQALAREPAHPWAAPSLHYARFRATGDVAERDRLLALAQRLPEQERPEQLVDLLLGELSWVNGFPWPGDASAKVVWELERRLSREPLAPPERGEPVPTATISVAHPESPSVTTALRLTLQRLGQELRVVVKVAAIPTPDPRLPRGPVDDDLLLWSYEGTDPVPLVGPPDEQVASAVATLASGDFRVFTWMAAARGLAEALGPDSLPGLLGAMLHPPELPADDEPGDLVEVIPPLIWVRLVQVAAALIIANLDQGWQGSLRRRALLGLARGPVDWTTDAAIVALGQVAIAEPAAVPEIAALFAELRAQIPAGVFTCYELPLLCTWSILPGISEQERAGLLRRRDEIVARTAEDDSDDAEE